ncbi:MAG: D-alanine--D-alanine ligase [Oleispira sp.]
MSYEITVSEKEALGKVAVLMGGTSAERSVSLNSGAAILSALLELGIDAFGIDIGENAAVQLSQATFDRAFIALHGRGGEDGTMQGLLELLNKPYTGSGVMASALGMDKWRTKLVWDACEIATPKAFVLEDNSDWDSIMQALGGLAMVKPAREGSSIGMRKVHSSEGLADSYAFASQHDDLVIAEQYIEGPEFTVTILGDEALPAIQLVTTHDFYDFDAKYKANDTQYLLPSGLPDYAEGELQKMALKAFKIVGCEGWGRVDAMQDSEGAFWLLEVNTTPGMTDHSLVPMAAKAGGLTFPALVVKILQQTL